MALEITNLRFLDQLRGGKPPGAEVSMLKIKGTEIQQAVTEMMMQAAGPLAHAFRPVDGVDFDDFTGAARRPVLQPPQGHDLRGLERDPAKHHRQDDARPVRGAP